MYVNSKWRKIPVPVDINVCHYYKMYRKSKVAQDYEAHSNIIPCGVVPVIYLSVVFCTVILFSL